MEYQLQNVSSENSPSQIGEGLNPISGESLDSCVPQSGRTLRGYGRMALVKKFFRCLVLVALVGGPAFGDPPTTYILKRAAELAQKTGSASILPRHVAIATLEEMAGGQNISSAKDMAIALNLGPEKIGPVIGALNKLPQVEKAKPGATVSASADLQQILSEAQVIATRSGAAAADGTHPVTIGHLFTALLETKNGEITAALEPLQVSRKVLDGSLAVTGKGADDKSSSLSSNEEILAKYSEDLTAKARAGKVEPAIGRDDEVERVMQTLLDRRKNNPALLGEAGVGKTQIAESVALKLLADENVPVRLKDKRILALDMSALIAGTQFRGAFEENLKKFLAAVKADGNVILFIDEVHQVADLGSTGEGGNGGAQILKPLWARGELPSIVATTTDEYKKHIEKDPALQRRFQPVIVEESNREDTLQILRGVAPYLASYHGVEITEEAIKAAYDLSQTNMQGNQPDKSITALGGAASGLEFARDTGRPGALRAITTEINKLANQIVAAESAPDTDLNRKKLKDLEALHAEKVARRKEITAAFDRGTEILGLLAVETDAATIEKLNKELDGIRKAFNIHNSVMGREHVAIEVSKRTGVPLSGINETERDRILGLPARLNAVVRGQSHAVQAVSEGIAMSRGGFQEKVPTVFLFAGRSGTGKTKLTSELAKKYYGDEKALIKIGMGKYGRALDMAGLIGGSIGYVGYDEPGRLTGAVRKRGRSVVNLDEIEKAKDNHGQLNNQLYDMLLTTMDDGFMEDGKGQLVDFSNSVIIMTTNVGAHLVDIPESQMSMAQKKAELRRLLIAEGFREEFLNRIGVDNIVLFNNLGEADVKEILKLKIDEVRASPLADKGISLTVAPEAEEKMVEFGYFPEQGARGLDPAVKGYVKKPLNELLLQNGDEAQKQGAVHIGWNSDAGAFDYQIPVRDCPGEFAKLSKPVQRKGEKMQAPKREDLDPPDLPVPTQTLAKPAPSPIWQPGMPLK
jgi:ATP-dependent Clp protease ATP-binding subunit ClpA